MEAFQVICWGGWFLIIFIESKLGIIVGRGQPEEVHAGIVFGIGLAVPIRWMI